MAGKTSKAAEQLAAIQKGLRREIQLRNAVKEIDDKIVILQRQRNALAREQNELREVLTPDDG